MSEHGRRRFVGRDIWLTEMVHRIGHEHVLSRCEFVGCNIVGPAVVSFGESAVEGCSTYDPLDSVGWGTGPERSHDPAGLVVLRHCVLRDCTLDRVGILAHADAPFELRPAVGSRPRYRHRGPRTP